MPNGTLIEYIGDYGGKNVFTKEAIKVYIVLHN